MGVIVLGTGVALRLPCDDVAQAFVDFTDGTADQRWSSVAHYGHAVLRGGTRRSSCWRSSTKLPAEVEARANCNW
jgi:hypothetical protein